MCPQNLKKTRQILLGLLCSHHQRGDVVLQLSSHQKGVSLLKAEVSMLQSHADVEVDGREHQNVIQNNRHGAD